MSNRVNDSQKRLARNTDLYDYLLDTESENWEVDKTKDNPNKQIRSNIDGCDCIVTKGLGYWFVDNRPRDSKGNNAISFLINYRGYDFVSAVQRLCKYSNYTYGQNVAPKSLNVSQKDVMRNRRANLALGQIVLPEANEDNKRVFAYLCKTRGLNRKYVTDMIAKNRLYQDKNGNCVFVNPEATNGELKGTLTEFVFKGTLANSDTLAPILISQLNNEQITEKVDFTGFNVVCTESVIDGLSLLELMIDFKIYGGANPNKLIIASLGGLKQLTLQAIKERFNGAKVFLAIDNDQPADEFYSKHGQGLTRLQIPKKYGKDWNDVLKIYKQRKEV